MDKLRFLECLDADFTRLRSVVADAMTAPVPSCPGWTGADLATHVAEVYLHKTEAMRLSAWPTPWPPDLSGDPLGALDDHYRQLVAELTARDVGAPTLTWYPPDQTVGFWVRRMAQETVIHRLDAELAAGVPYDPIPTDLAVDGIDEVLVRFLAFGSVEAPDELPDLAECDGRTVRITTEEASWQLQLGPEVISVERGESDSEAGVSGTADAVLCWLWRRPGKEVRLDGDRWVIGKLREMMKAATQ